jgi:hypothetical protein
MILRSQQLLLQLSLLFSSLVALLVFALSGCGQSATSSDSVSNTQSQNGTTEPGNHQPNARVYTAGQTVALDGSSSSDPDSLSYQWTKTTGPDITLSNTTGSSLSFVVPSIEQSQQISFQYFGRIGRWRGVTTGLYFLMFY